MAGLNAEGRRLVSDYIRVLLASGLYAEAEETECRVLPLYTLAASAGRASSWTGTTASPRRLRGAPAEADFAVRIGGRAAEPEIETGRSSGSAGVRRSRAGAWASSSWAAWRIAKDCTWTKGPASFRQTPGTRH